MIDTIRLAAEEQLLFQKTPESGMGYHYLEVLEPSDAEIDDDLRDSLIISNSEALYLSAKNWPISVFWQNESLRSQEFSPDLLKEIRKIFRGIRSDLKLFSKYEDEKEVIGFKKTEVPAPPHSYVTRQGDEFRRLSAFRNDNRIQKDGSLRKGSYGTTILDLESATSGVSAVGRYALPNRFAACYVFQIIPPPGTPVLFGTVTPNFGLCGGGVEVYFPNGCAEGSVRLLGTIPEF